MTVAELIRTSREQKYLTQAELAARSGTSQSTLSRYESGEAVPTISTLQRLLASAGATLRLTAALSARDFDARTPRMSLIRAKRREIIETALKYGATNVCVFGSVARGTDRIESDIDVLVDFDASKLGLIHISELAEELTSLLGQPVEVAVRQLLSPRVAATALAEEVPI